MLDHSEPAKRPPRKPLKGNAKLKIEASADVLEVLRPTLENVFGIKYEGKLLDSNTFPGLKYQVLEIEVTGE